MILVMLLEICQLKGMLIQKLLRFKKTFIARIKAKAQQVKYLLTILTWSIDGLLSKLKTLNS